MVTVKELIEILQKEDPERVVIMSKDSEGNGFSPLSVLEGNSKYLPESTWYGETGLEILTKELKSQGYCDEDVMSNPDAVSCIVLWPTN